MDIGLVESVDTETAPEGIFDVCLERLSKGMGGPCRHIVSVLAFCGLCMARSLLLFGALLLSFVCGRVFQIQSRRLHFQFLALDHLYLDKLRKRLRVSRQLLQQARALVEVSHHETGHVF